MATAQINLPPDLRRIVIFHALFLGDLLMAVPAWHALRRRFPTAEISLIGMPWTSQILPNLPNLIDRLLPFPGYKGIHEVPYEAERSEQFLSSQRSYGYDLAIQMHGNGSSSNGFVAELGATASLGYALPGDERLSNYLPYNPEQNEMLRWLELAALTGASTDEMPTFKLNPSDAARAQAIMPRPAAGLPIIGMHVGAKDPARRWPATRFAALGQELHQRTGAEFVLTGGAIERVPCRLVCSMIAAPATDLSARTTIGEFAAVITNLDLLITNDTGASHLAAALGTPSVVIFGPTRPHIFAPLNRELHQVVDALDHTPSRFGPVAALRSLPVDPVLRAALKQLDTYHRRKSNVALATRMVGR